MQIGGPATQRVYWSKDGRDIFLVLDVAEETVTLYRTVETLLCPSRAAYEQYMHQPYYHSEETGMMSVLEAVCQRNYATGRISAAELMKEMQSEIP